MITGIIQIVVMLLPVILAAMANHKVAQQSPQGKHEKNESLLDGSDAALSLAIDDKLRARTTPTGGQASHPVG